MAKAKIAFWNIYFSWNLVEKRDGKYSVKHSQRKRAGNVAEIINTINSDIFGIVECMGPADLKFFVRTFCPQYDGILLTNKETKYNLALLYKKEVFNLKKASINLDPWYAKIGNDPRKKRYYFARRPLVVQVTHKGSGSQTLLALMHTKSKFLKRNGMSFSEYQEKSLNNRKRIIATGERIRELLFRKASGSSSINRFIVMGDLNDGLELDDYERKLDRGGIEAFLGSVFDPKHILYSAVSLVNGKGEPSSSFESGKHQLDHILFTQNMERGPKPRVVAGTGDVRDDLVDLKNDGKRRDSDHAPVEVIVDF